MTPDQYTIEEKMIGVGHGHKLYVQFWGNKAADEAIIFLHGGPGSGCSDNHKTLFDPTKQKVIFFDQRGSGKSTPNGSLIANNTDHMVDDISKIADSFGFDTFALTGGSWGCCLALTYSIKNPRRVTRMVLRGIFTGRKSEIEFVDKGHFMAYFPDVWEKFVDSVPENFRADPSSYHLQRVFKGTKSEAKRSAYAFAELESSIISIDDRVHIENYKDFEPASTIIELHYTSNGCFLPESYVIDNLDKLSMPIKLVQGRYDSVCPPFTAFEISQKLKNAELFWTTSGHSGHDRSNWEVTKALLSSK
ncbi:MAG TPA: alpha/beta fold hydrolase [Candidatus Saccharimonadales bacterium]|nr:alpha/beta fold hydrolase [Candidatus Saccharimonadales bacterium]